MAKNAIYKVYDEQEQDWIEYHFTTNAGRVSTTDGRKFLTTSVTVNGNNAGTAGAKVTVGAGDAANIEIDAGHISWFTGSKPSTNYLTSAENIQAALQELDTRVKTATDSIPSGVLTTSNFGTSGYYPNLEDIEEGVENSTNQTGYLVKKVNGWELDMLGTAIHKNYTTSVTENSGDLVTSGGVYTAISTAISGLPTPMQFKGTLGTNGTITTLPSASASNNGYMYKVITDGTYQSIAAKVGDAFVSDGTNWILIPSGDESFTDTWRQINVNGSQLLASGISTGVLNFVNGDNITFTGSGNNITIGVASGYSIPSTNQQNSWTAKQDALGYTPVNKAGDTMTGNLTIQGTSSNPAQLSLTESALNLAVLTLTGDYIQAKGSSAKLNFPAILADQTFATQEWTQGIFARVTVSTGSTAPSYTGLKTGDIWIN